MELRVLQYFLAVAREQNVSRAAESLHLSQPTLSRQLRDMEEELGKQLFIRGSRRITLTDEGMILRKRAEEILDLVKKTETEIAVTDSSISGDVYIGAGETEGVHFLTKAARLLQQEHPDVRFHIASGDTTDVTDDLDKGLIDFGLLFDPVDKSRYEYLRLPFQDSYGVLMRRDSELASKDAITPEDLWDKPLSWNRNTRDDSPLAAWLRRDLSQVHNAATYNLLFNGSLMVKDGLGYAFSLENVINPTDSDLCFKPLSPALKANMSIVWKKYQIFSKPAEKFLIKLQELTG